MRKIVVLFLLAILCAAPIAFAADENASKELIYRVNLGRAADVKLLLGKGASPDTLDDKGVPVLALAAARKDDEGMNVLKALIEAGAKTETKDKDGQTALFYAAQQGNKAAAIYLMQHGASYYTTDNHGDTARNIAHRENHDDVMEAMDNEVRAQTDRVRQQYEEANKTLEERYKAEAEVIRNQQAALASAQQKQTAPASQKPAETAPAATNEATDAEKAAEAEAAAIREMRKKIDPLVHDLIFNNCAFQYWSYVRAASQSTEMSADELRDTIKSYKEDIVKLNQTLMDDYHFTPEQISIISLAPKQRVFNQLEAMPSKAYRHEKGVGKETDMQTRCQDIAEGFGDISDAITTAKPAKGAAGHHPNNAALNQPTALAPTTPPHRPPRRRHPPKKPVNNDAAQAPQTVNSPGLVSP